MGLSVWGLDNMVNDLDLVSVIMGTYNCEKTIGYAIESILRQTYKNFEFIICDDGSTDDTLSIIKAYAEKDTRITVLYNECNMRLAASLNRCLHVARGKYIARMDADDESLPTRLEIQIDFLEKHPEYDVVGCNRIIFDGNGNHGVRKSIEFPNKNVLIKDTPFAHPTIMMKKRVYDVLGGYRDSKATMRAEDLDLWFRFFENSFQGYNLQQVLYRYHESYADYTKRSLKAGVQTARVFWNGYKRIHVPYYKRIWALKPIISALVPNWIMRYYHLTKIRS